MKEADNWRIFVLIAAAMTSPVAGLAVLLLSVAAEWHSRYFALGILAFFGALAITASIRYVADDGKRKWLQHASTFTVAAMLLAIVLSFVNSPDGSHHSKASFRAVEIDTSGHERHPRTFNRWSPSNLVAEVDQLSMGNALVPMLDRFIDRNQSKRIGSLFSAVYADMRHANRMEDVGSQLGANYAELLGHEFRNHQGYVYRPDTAAVDEALPVFLFLHGSLGNFKGYIWVLHSLANQHRFAIIAPTFGAGNWNRKGGVEAIEQWIQYCESQPGLDGSRIILAGLSSGGRGVSHIWAKYPNRFHGIILLSPVIESEIPLTAFRAAEITPSTPLLIIHGDNDRRIPLNGLLPHFRALTSEGISCDLTRFPDEDHFLFFSQPETVIEKISQWLKEKAVLTEG